MNLNVLSERYATKEINNIFSKKGKILAERELWISVLKAQKEAGLVISDEVIKKYELVKANIDLDLIDKIERKTRHDVKARIEAFVQTANTEEHIHKGMTSRDLTDNVEQMQIKNASKIIFEKYVAILKSFVEKAQDYNYIVLTARTHHQPAQCTLLGRRFSMWAEELILHLDEFEHFIDNYPLRGIKGAVGTQFDMLTLLGSEEKVDLLEQKVAQSLGFNNILINPGQVYPRSLDLSLVSKLTTLSSACENFAKSIRLMAGYELLTEGFKKDQVGSSAMPHKMNTRSSERICSLSELVKMYYDGASRLSGDQWEEGDVSCSVLRRVIIPDVFYASDGICETTLTVLKEMGVYEDKFSEEVAKYLPFLATTEMLMLAVQAGIGREQAHELIKKHAINTVLNSRTKKNSCSTNYDFIACLTAEKEFKDAGLTKEKINQLLQDTIHFTGNASEQINQVAKKANYFFEKYDSNYTPSDIL